MQSLFYNQVLNTSRNLLNTVLKVKIRMAVWVQNSSKYTCALPLWPCGWPGPAAAAAQHHKTVLYCISPAWGNIKLQNSKYDFYWMCIAFTPLWSWNTVSWTIISERPSVFSLLAPWMSPSQVQACSHLRVFTQAAPSAWNAFLLIV